MCNDSQDYCHVLRWDHMLSKVTVMLEGQSDHPVSHC